MAPLPKDSVNPIPVNEKTCPVPEDEAVVISGASGLLPECDSFAEFTDKIFQNKNLVSSSPRWSNFKYPELPEQFGRIAGLNRFDAQFFTVFYSLAQSIDPLARKIFEQTYQAIFDSGINPIELWGRHVGVFMSYGFCETEKLNFTPDLQLGIIGACKAMTANRVSYWLNLQGPSVYMDGSSCGALLALEKAKEAIMDGRCESAIVGCGKVILHPQIPISHRSMPLNYDGKTKCYDEAADGASMSEAAVVFFLQKHKDAKRAYCVLRHVRAQFRASEEKILECDVPQDARVLTNFFRQFYDEVGVDPKRVGYVEGYGAGFLEMDKIELEAMEAVFCKDRTDPLLVGSVSSNVGYTESATSACAIMKLISAYQRGEMPATINCENPRRDIAALQDGRMRIVTANTTFNRPTYVGVNAFSYTGLNGHGLLESCYKAKNLSKYPSDIPYLVAVSGRQESAVQKILDDIKSRPLDPEEIALIHNIHKNRISKHLARGFGVYETINNATATRTLKVDYHDDVSRPLWFVYSGMGSQWIGMGRELMRIPIFNQAIQRCHKILQSKGVDLINIITCNDEHIFDNILNSFVGIAAIQIGLTDILTAIGLVPDKVIGHSLGELGCAYADGCFSAEQTILLAYNRGLVSIQTPFINGSMAAVGMGYKNISKICPSEIEVACHNSVDSSTISGPAKSVKEFVASLTKQGVFAKEVQCSNIPYHSSYIAEAGPDFLRLSAQVVKEPKLRSAKWLSSSVPQEQWTEPHALHSSAQYHTNNLLNKVLFEEVLRHVPSNAVLVEIAPHGLLQAILKRALSTNCRCVPLTRRGDEDSTVFLLKALGNLYMEGFDADISALYPKIEFPVSTETRSLSHLVEWAHGEKWNLCQYVNKDRFYCSVLKLLVAVEDDEYKYLNGHYVEGVRVFPYAAALVAVWDTIAMTAGHKKREISVQFTDVKCHSQPPVYDQQVLYLETMVQRGSGRFEVIYKEEVIIEGYVVIVAGRGFGMNLDEEHKYTDEFLNKEDIYKIFYEKGFEYKDDFRSIHSINTSMTQAQVEWRDNWVTFIDGVFQTCALRNFKDRSSSEMSFVKKIVVDVKAQTNESLVNRDSLYTASYAKIYNRTRCGGLTIDHVFHKSRPLPTRQSVTLQSEKFQPFFQNNFNDVTSALYVTLQVLSEHVNRKDLTLFNINLPNKRDFNNKVKSLAENQPIITTNIILGDTENLFQSKNTPEKLDAIIVHDLLSDKKVFETLYKTLPANTFLISIGVETKNMYPVGIYRPICAFGSGQNRVELAILKPHPKPTNTTAVSVRNNSDIHHLNSICKDLSRQHKLLILSSYPAPTSVKDVVKFWRDNNRNVTLVMFDQKDTLHKELENIPDVPFCALSNGLWGNEYFIPTKCEGNVTKTSALRCTQPGNLDSLRWVEVQNPTGPGIEVTVYYAGLSVRDARMATVEKQDISTSASFGMDFSGVTTRGYRVMGLIAGGSASSKVIAQPELLWPVPAHWSLEDAATVPLAYAHAFYCMKIKFDLKKGMTVLVHGGAGALGQAAISIALAHGCRVFTTVSDLNKKRFLKNLFPELRDDHIGNSRDGSFADMVKKHLKRDSRDAGCDLVIGFTKGELKDLSLSCCGVSGYTLDVAQLVEQEHFQFGMSHLFCCRTYSVVDLSSVFRENNSMDMRKLQLLMSEGIKRGYVRPLTRVCYEPRETPRAFRLLAGSRHRGRVLLALPRAMLATPRNYFNVYSISCTPDRNHLVICDKEGFGLQFADTLVERGTSRLYLHCQNTPYLKHKVEIWESKGVHVETISDSIVGKDDAHHLLADCSRSGDIEGVYVIATNQVDKQEMATLVANLDDATRKMCQHLRYFSVISEDDKSWRDVLVNRARDGLPSLSLQLLGLQKFDIGNESQSASKLVVALQWRYAVEAIEAALTSRDNLIVAYSQPTPTLTILKEVAKIPGVNITNAAVGRTTLEQVGLDQDRAQELCYILQQKFNITISKDIVPQMTIAQLEKLQRQSVDIERNPDGFTAYFTYFDPDAMQASCDLVIMPTLVHRSKLRADEFDVDRDYLCVVPGLEGHYARFDTLCERLKIPAVVLQPDPADGTLEEMAQRMVGTIMKKLTPKKTFYLLGYEFGVLVALEIASILEKKGLTGTVYMLGGTPLDICNSFNHHWKDTSPEGQQNALISHMYSLVAGRNSIELDNKLQNANNWTEKVEMFAKKLSYSIQYTRGLVQGAHNRIQLLQNYDFRKHNLQSKLVLIRAKLSTAPGSLKGYHKEMSVHNIRASLAHAAKDLSCSNIINIYLDKDIIEDYENSNQCDTCLKSEDFIKLNKTFD